MANELNIALGVTGLTNVTASIRQGASVTNAGIACGESSSAGFYSGSMTGIAAGTYDVLFFVGDRLVNAGRIVWDGTAEVVTSSVPTAASIRAEMDANSTKLANLDATVSSRMATSEYTAPPTTEEVATEVAVTMFVDGRDNKLKVNPDNSASATIVGEIPVDISGIPAISVTIPSAVVAASQEPSVITCLRGDTLRVSLPVMGNLVDRTKLIITAKSNLNDLDAESVIQIIEGTGLVRLNGVTPTDSNTASLTVQDEATGAADLRIDAAVTSILAIQDLVWDAQVHLPSSIVSPISGTFSVVADVTRTIT